MKNDLGSPKFKNLTCSLKQLWTKAKADQTKHLNSPESLPEFLQTLVELENLTVADISQNPDFQQKLIASTEIQLLEIFNNKKVTVQLIFLPPKYTFQIHDHPEMLLISKLLQGEVEVTKFDLVNRKNIYQQIRNSDFSKAVVQKKEVVYLKENQTDFVYPDSCNLHSIFSLKRAVILDIMVNSYDFTKRDCTFFRLGEQIEGDYFEVFHFNEWDLIIKTYLKE